MQGRLLLSLIFRRLQFSTFQLSSIRRISSSSEEPLTENLSIVNTERPYKENPSENFASHRNPNSDPNSSPNLHSIVELIAKKAGPKLELHPSHNTNLVTNPSFDASLPEFEKCIWAVERLSKGKKYTKLDKVQNRVPGFVCEQDSPKTGHVFIVMDRFQIQNLWSVLGEEKFLRTVFTLEIFEGFDSNNVLHRERVLPRRINFNKSGAISNVGYAKAPLGKKLRLDIPIRICGQEDCTGLRKGGFLKVYLSYVSVFCLPEELPTYVEINVNGMDIGERICLGDLRCGVPLHSNNQPSLPVCEIIRVHR